MPPPIDHENTAPTAPRAGSALLAATVTFAGIRPRLARFLAALTLTATAVILGLSAADLIPVHFGHVTQTMWDGREQLAALTPLWGSPFAVRVVNQELPALELGEIAVAFGDKIDREVVTTGFGSAPMRTSDFADLHDQVLSVLQNSSEVGTLIIAVVLAIFAPLLLRIGGAVLVGAGLWFLTLVLVTANLEAEIIALPVSAAQTLAVLAGFSGAAIGFRAAFRDRKALWLRIVGTIAAALCLMAFYVNGLAPLWVLLPLPVIALGLPSVSILLVAAWIVAETFNMSALETGLIIPALLAVRGGAAWLTRQAPDPIRSAAERILPTDHTGHVSLLRLAKELH